MSNDIKEPKHRPEGVRRPQRKDSFSSVHSVLSWTGLQTKIGPKSAISTSSSSSTNTSSTATQQTSTPSLGPSKPRRHSHSFGGSWDSNTKDSSTKKRARPASMSRKLSFSGFMGIEDGAGAKTRHAKPTFSTADPKRSSEESTKSGSKNSSSEKVNKTAPEAAKRLSQSSTLVGSVVRSKSPPPPTSTIVPKSILRVSSPDGGRRPRFLDPPGPGEQPHSPSLGAALLSPLPSPSTSSEQQSQSKPPLSPPLTPTPLLDSPPASPLLAPSRTIDDSEAGARCVEEVVITEVIDLTEVPEEEDDEKTVIGIPKAAEISVKEVPAESPQPSPTEDKTPDHEDPNPEVSEVESSSPPEVPSPPLSPSTPPFFKANTASFATLHSQLLSSEKEAAALRARRIAERVHQSLLDEEAKNNPNAPKPIISVHLASHQTLKSPNFPPQLRTPSPAGSIEKPENRRSLSHTRSTADLRTFKLPEPTTVTGVGGQSAMASAMAAGNGIVRSTSPNNSLQLSRGRRERSRNQERGYMQVKKEGVVV
ncbi:hypothetical protein B0T21DRAFT_382863 [Apiosordaria backusii]|uniref:Uncharacterized protein n=1 Tax=Apiosordaria backusii TaxID=314023 RepID=A0AA40BT90_9PEZI|nr:hypothetical protein B0T21DRAFT_382863 [Apiosordaria backusii]